MAPTTIKAKEGEENKSLMQLFSIVKDQEKKRKPNKDNRIDAGQYFSKAEVML